MPGEPCEALDLVERWPRTEHDHPGLEHRTRETGNWRTPRSCRPRDPIEAAPRRELVRRRVVGRDELVAVDAVVLRRQDADGDRQERERDADERVPRRAPKMECAARDECGEERDDSEEPERDGTGPCPVERDRGARGGTGCDGERDADPGAPARRGVAGVAAGHSRDATLATIEVQAAVLISVVVPVYEESDLVTRLHEELRGALDSLDTPWEIVYVNDGSRDDSLALLRKAQGTDARVAIVELSRNWGHQAALSAGLNVARGDAVVLIDGDLQDPPAVIPELVAAWREGAEVVIAERRSRVETGLRALLFPAFYRALGFLSDFPIPLNTGIFGLLDRRAVDAINVLQETNRYLPGLRAWIGFPTRVVLYDRRERAAGRPKQTFWRLLRYALDAIFSFSYKPLRLSLLAGLLVAFFSLAYGVVLIMCRVLGHRPVRDPRRRRLHEHDRRDPVSRGRAAHQRRDPRRVPRARLRRGQAPAALRDPRRPAPEAVTVRVARPPIGPSAGLRDLAAL